MKGDPKRIRTEIPTYQTNALPLGQTSSKTISDDDDDELMLNVLRCHLTY